MAKKKKYRSKADAEFARKDDIKLAKERAEREKVIDKERAIRDALPMFSACPVQDSSKWFWATWGKASDFTGTQSMPAKFGLAESKAAAIQAARSAAGPDSWQSLPSAAGPTYQFLKRIGKI